MSNPELSDVTDCPLGQALRVIREASERDDPFDWSTTPLGRFYEAHARELARKRRASAGKCHTMPWGRWEGLPQK